MCDTFVALGSHTRDGRVIFAKNSDREPNEAHEVVLVPAADYPKGAMLRCTYVDIPQVAHSNALLLAKPFWIWGAEMGCNEFGVTIGNEAVFTRLPYQTEPGLIGMDLLRLGLERSASAEEALNVITGLLKQYGQGGNCGLTHPFYYHNSFLIADPHEAWVLETAGQEWAAEKVRGFRSISNRISIGGKWDLASEGLVQTALDRGWCKSRSDFDFSRCYSDFLYTRFGASAHRQACTTQLLASQRDGLTPGDAMRFLRAHGVPERRNWRPDPALAGAEVCMHAGFGPIRINQSTGSMVAHLDPHEPAASTCWVTATSAPCTGIFKPLWLNLLRPWDEPVPKAVYDPACLWWRHEQLHRAVLQDYPTRIASYRQERDTLEALFIQRAGDARTLSTRQEESLRSWQEADAAEQEWLSRVQALPISKVNRFYYKIAWSDFNHKAGFLET